MDQTSRKSPLRESQLILGGMLAPSIRHKRVVTLGLWRVFLSSIIVETSLKMPVLASMPKKVA